MHHSDPLKPKFSGYLSLAAMTTLSKEARLTLMDDIRAIESSLKQNSAQNEFKTDLK